MGLRDWFKSTPATEADDDDDSAAAERDPADEMTALDYLTFLGYIGGFVVFFYAIAAAFGVPK